MAKLGAVQEVVVRITANASAFVSGVNRAAAVAAGFSDRLADVATRGVAALTRGINSVLAKTQGVVDVFSRALGPVAGFAGGLASAASGGVKTLTKGLESVVSKTNGVVSAVNGAVGAVAGFAGRLASAAAGGVAMLARGLAALASGLLNVASRAATAGTALTAIGFAAFTGIAVKAARETTAFGDSLSQLWTLIDDGQPAADKVGIAIERSLQRTRIGAEALSATIAGLSDELDTLAIQFGRDVADQAAALYEIIASGVEDPVKAMQLLDRANRLAIGGIVDLKTAASGLTAAMAAYGDAIKDASEVSDALFVAAALGQADIEELVAGIGRVAPVAAAAGVSLDELMGAAGVLTKYGIQTSTAIDGLRAVMTAVIRPTDQAAKAAERLGIDFNAAALRSRGLQRFLEDVGKKTKGSTEELALLFGRVEALLPVLTLTGSGARDFASALELMQKKTGATETAFQKMSSSISFAVGQLQQVWRAFLRWFGADVLALISPVIAYLQANGRELAESLHRDFQWVVNSIGDIVGAAGVTVEGFVNALMKSLNVVITAFGHSSETIGAALRQILDAARSVFAQFGGLAQTAGRNFYDHVLGALEAAIQRFVPWAANVVSGVIMVLGQLPAAVAPLLQALQGAFGMALDWIAGHTENWGEAVVGAITVVSEKLRGFVEWMQSAIPAAIEFVKPVWDELVATVRHLASEFVGVSESAERFASDAAVAVRDAVIALLQTIQQFNLEGLREKIRGWVELAEIILKVGGVVYALNMVAKTILSIREVVLVVLPLVRRLTSALIKLGAARALAGLGVAGGVVAAGWGIYELIQLWRNSGDDDVSIDPAASEAIAAMAHRRVSPAAPTVTHVENRPQLVVAPGAIQINGVQDPRLVAEMVRRELQQRGRTLFGNESAVLGLA